MIKCNEVSESTLGEWIKSADLLIFGSGYEDRSHEVPKMTSALPKRCAIGVTYKGGDDGNLHGRKFAREYGVEVKKSGKHFRDFEFSSTETKNLEYRVSEVFAPVRSVSIDRVLIDVSGLTQFLIMLFLAEIRESWPLAEVIISYRAALSYPPSSDLMENWLEKRRSGEEAELTKDLIFESSDPISPNRFAGVAQRRGSAALFLFAGYEKHRSKAAFDIINPARLVIFHSRPAVLGGDLRLEFSQEIHRSVGGNLSRSVELLDNTDICGHIQKLEEYYEFLYDLHDIILVPVHSKLQTLACYLFWERFQDVQVTFPVPLWYHPSQGGTGIGNLYGVVLPIHPRFEPLYGKDACT